MWMWQVIEQDGTNNSGVVDSFDEAVGALHDWQGAADDDPHRVYQIVALSYGLEQRVCHE